MPFPDFCGCYLYRVHVPVVVVRITPLALVNSDVHEVTTRTQVHLKQFQGYRTLTKKGRTAIAYARRRHLQTDGTIFVRYRYAKDPTVNCFGCFVLQNDLEGLTGSHVRYVIAVEVLELHGIDSDLLRSKAVVPENKGC